MFKAFEERSIGGSEAVRMIITFSLLFALAGLGYANLAVALF